MPTALIVEDEPEANRLLALLVQLRGYGTDSAFTGGEALEKVRRRPPDVVFLDLMLPDIDGYEVCKRLKAARSTSLIPVIVVTARVAEQNRLESFQAGADDYVPKPYTPDQIFQAIEEAGAWRQGLDCREPEGDIELGAASDEVLRRLARLRSLMIARTSLGAETVRAAGEALEELRARAVGRAHALGVDVVAEFSYRLLDDRVVFTLRDRSGWLEGGPFRADEGPLPASARRLFDEVLNGDSGGTMTLVLRHPRPA
jgi:CheY-like chemotaxis protein